MNRRGFFKLLGVSPIALIFKPEKKFTRDKLIVNKIKIHAYEIDPFFSPAKTFEDFNVIFNLPSGRKINAKITRITKGGFEFKEI